MKFEDSQIDFNKNINGNYRVGNKFFYKKYNAVLEAVRTNQQVNWDFHRISFEHAINNSTYSYNLLDLYKIRAQQLRDTYDYLILAYSGGSDSDNILKTFLFNNIKLDEIWSDFPKSLIEKSNYILTTSLDSDNMAAEMYTVVIPELVKISENYPNIKIHFSDNWGNRTIEDHEDTLSILNVPANYLLIQRYRYIMNYAKKIAESGKKVAIIQGIDKPIPWINKNNEYGVIFSDKATFYKSDIIDGVYIPWEYFYWSPVFPEIAIGQAKNLWNYLLQNKKETQVKLLNITPGSTEIDNRQSGFDNIIKRICFPYWDFNKIQVNKSGTFYNKNYINFIQQHQGEKTYQSYVSAIKILNTLPTHIFNGETIKSDIKWNYCFFKLGNV